MIEAKVFRAFIRIYCVFKSEQLSASIKLTLHKGLIRSVMTYACPARELAVDTYHLKLHRLQNKVLGTIGNFRRFTPVRDLHMAFSLPYVYDYITKLCRRLAEAIQNHANDKQKSYKIMRMKPDLKNIRGLNLAVVKLTSVQVTVLPL
jgi:hypothetical protein